MKNKEEVIELFRKMEESMKEAIILIKKMKEAMIEKNRNSKIESKHIGGK